MTTRKCNLNTAAILFFVIIFNAISLSACGFHLRGNQYSNYKFPFKHVFLDCGSVAICQNLRTSITTESLAFIESSPNNPNTFTLRVINEQTARDPQGFNAVGRISAFMLTYQAQAQITHNGQQVGDNIVITQRLIMQYNDSTILADTTEEDNFWTQLHEMATNQLIHKIIYFKPLKEYNDKYAKESTTARRGN